MKKVALITWASSWIGFELAKIHAENLWDLVLVARRLDKLNELKEKLEKAHWVEVLVIQKDLTEPNASKELYDEINEKGIEVEYLINNAWFGGQWAFHERNWQDDKNMIQLNIMVLTELTRLFLDDMVKRNSWRILNVWSTAAFMPGPLQAVYFATKSYVKFFSNAISEELKWTKITVTNLMPGATKTEFAETSGMDKTGLFEKTFSARHVAEEWYNWMMKWKIDVVSWLTFAQKIMMWIIPFVPKKMMLKAVYDMQKVD